MSVCSRKEPTLAEQAIVFSKKNVVWRKVRNGIPQRRSDKVDLCEIKYLGSSLIDFE